MRNEKNEGLTIHNRYFADGETTLVIPMDMDELWVTNNGAKNKVSERYRFTGERIDAPISDGRIKARLFLPLTGKVIIWQVYSKICSEEDVDNQKLLKFEGDDLWFLPIFVANNYTLIINTSDIHP